MSEIRIYADTSVFGGAFDEEFQTVTRTFFSQVRNGRFKLVTSALVQEEIDPAPAQVRELFDESNYDAWTSSPEADLPVCCPN